MATAVEANEMIVAASATWPTRSRYDWVEATEMIVAAVAAFAVETVSLSRILM